MKRAGQRVSAHFSRGRRLKSKWKTKTNRLLLILNLNLKHLLHLQYLVVAPLLGAGHEKKTKYVFEKKKIAKS